MGECVSNLKLQAQEGSSDCVQLGTCTIMMGSCIESATYIERFHIVLTVVWVMEFDKILGLENT